MKKEQRKKISFVAFVMAIFFAGVVLAEFHSEAWMLIIAGVVLLVASGWFIWDRGGEKEQSPSEKTAEILLADRMAELMRGNEKAEKGVYIAVKKQHEAMEAGMSMLEARLNELVKAQESAMKTLVLYNKENARQIALSERDEIEHLCKELQAGFASLKSQTPDKDFMEEATSPVVAATKQIGNRIYEELHETNEAILSELESTVDGIEEMKTLLAELVHSNVLEKLGNLVDELPRAPLEAVIPAEKLEEKEPVTEFEPEAEIAPVMEFEPEPEIAPVMEFEPEVEIEEPTLIEEAAPIEEPEPEVQSAPEDAFAASGVDLSDPNRTLSADDIAALIAAASGGASEPEPEAAPIMEFEPEPIVEIEEETPIEEPEPEAESTSEDAFAASGVDLSDPNRTLSADDIAALIAAASGEASEPEPEAAPIMEPEPEAESTSEDAFAASGVDLSDPNRTLSADDIAALIAAASGGASEPEPEIAPVMEFEPESEVEIEEPAPIEESEPEAQSTSEDAFAASGVDLSDPNRTLSADDIAALIASLGN